MALNAYLKLKGQKQGEIKGSVTQKGREGKIMVVAVNHGITAVADVRGGASSGKRIHQPLTITKELDKASTGLLNALINSEIISEFELQFWTPQMKAAAGAGVELQHYTIKLTNAKITDIKFAMLNNKNPELIKYNEYEEVSFTYQKIEWIWVDGHLTAQDTI